MFSTVKVVDIKLPHNTYYVMKKKAENDYR